VSTICRPRFSKVVIVNLPLRVLTRPQQILIIGAEPVTDNKVLGPLIKIASPLEPLPAQSIKVSKRKRSVANIVVEIQALGITQIGMGKARRIR
jgi:hypothetical protein